MPSSQPNLPYTRPVMLPSELHSQCSRIGCICRSGGSVIGAADASSGSEESSEKEPSSGSCMPQGPQAWSVSFREVNVSSFMKFEVFMRTREVPFVSGPSRHTPTSPEKACVEAPLRLEQA